LLGGLGFLIFWGGKCISIVVTTLLSSWVKPPLSLGCRNGDTSPQSPCGTRGAAGGCRWDTVPCFARRSRSPMAEPSGYATSVQTVIH